MLLKGPILRAILHFPTVVGASVDTSFVSPDIALSVPAGVCL